MALLRMLDEVYGLPGNSGTSLTAASAAPAKPAVVVTAEPAPPAARRWRVGLLAALAWGGLAALTLLWPNQAVGFSDWAYTREFGFLAGAVGLLLLAAVGVNPGRASRWRAAGPWLVALPLLLGLWQVLTAKLAVLPTPFFAPPQSLAEVYIDDWKRLGESTWHSALLLVQGVSIGTVVGFLVGVSIGWSRHIGYWVHPVIRFVGPIPASALLPLAFFFFPSSHAAAVFLIALATGFPVAVLTWSGVASVNKQYYDVARTLGASEWFLVLRVAIPAALPQVFVGLFMGLGASFSILVTAEMMGVKAGLGWYLSWAQGWAAYTNMYAALIVMALLCSGLITLLFAVRDRVLSWQKGTVKW
ncbi:MAG TPA: ABC transporter permease subunit [Ideonella sp.]|nr:ABC transporter permease subunit [Ideonella sp.]HSI51028.1 ABC transporter permease subunit [Ideonella sp.]